MHTNDEDFVEMTPDQLISKLRELTESHTQVEQSLQARTKELTMLNEISTLVSGSFDLKAIMDAALCKTIETMRMDNGTAYSIEDIQGPNEEKFLVLQARRGLSPEFSQRVGSRRLRGTAIQDAVKVQKPVVHLVVNYPDLRVKKALDIEGVRQVINIPLFAKGEFVGAFNIGTRHERIITPEEIMLLSSIGQQIAIAVVNARLYHKAEQSAAFEERQRLSRELHDSVTQSLYSVTMFAEAAARLLEEGDTQTAAANLRELRDTAQEALREMRKLIFELRPLALEKVGLAAALQARLDAVESRGGMQTELQVDGIQDADHLPRMVEEQLYAIAQEALNNALKHSEARHVRVHLQFSEAEIQLEICDDGVGFTPAATGNGGLGLAGLKERTEKIGGRLEIESIPGNGTVIRVIIPTGSSKERDSTD